ncbi:hypothetical protein OQJ15_15240 [Fluoribacter dumoffii]|uniref:hypothetical protein n=1 Tax=Fluoribacter dumoffii TaxID=463 RepID=UPI00224462EE|nr:hypothetical protein [Fluoribacter dumoffii]MCW8387662.1 hypothetical protein [Fluoribacter dumoffii]MCW8497865.1 hypothetical protein [Fluoribacter dumoffii]
MHRLFLALLLSFIGTAFAAQKTVTCYPEGLENTLSFVVTDKIGAVPKIDFDYPVEVTRFSMRAGNLLLVAMDQEEKDRPRIFISAQLNKKNQRYIGQFLTDSGGSELQLDNGPIFCTIK